MSQVVSSFYKLEPDSILQSAEEAGFYPTGEFTQLNSYENRVFDLKLEEPLSGSRNDHVISKFYRPGRWTKEAILAEHEFLFDLKKEGVHAVAPLIISGDSSLIKTSGLWTAFFPKVLGRMPQELVGEEWKQVGRLLARVHNIGSQKSAPQRPEIGTSYYGGWETLDLLQDWIAPEVRNRYLDVAENILHRVDEEISPEDYIRIHGDLHKGNLLYNGQEFFLVDFDDFVNGPVVQDFWMLFSGLGDEADEEKDLLLSGYEELRSFPYHQLQWIPYMRALRIIGYAGWIARRWEDPSFPRLFPEFNTYRYWAEEVEALERIAWSI